MISSGGHGGAADAKQSAFMTSLAYDFMFETLTKNEEAGLTAPTRARRGSATGGACAELGGLRHLNLPVSQVVSSDYYSARGRPDPPFVCHGDASRLG